MADFYYEPKQNKDLSLFDCMDLTEYRNFVTDIQSDTKLSQREKQNLTLLATRFIEFRYEKLADLYSISDDNMRNWLERLRCVIVDRDSAIKNGYFKYMEDYEKLLNEVVSDE